MGLADWTRLTIISLVWGSAFFLTEIVLLDTPPLTLAAWRITLGALAMLLFCLATGISLRLSRARFGQFLFMGFMANALPFSLIALGQTQITGGLSAIFIATTPLFTVLIGHLWNRVEPATPNKVAGVVVGLIGTIALIGFDVALDAANTLWGQACVLGAAFCYGLSAVFGRRFSDMPAPAAAAAMLVISSIMTMTLAITVEGVPIALPSTSSIVSLLVLGVLSTAMAYILYYQVLASAGATNAMLVTIVQPPVAILLGAMFLGETLAINQVIGLALILFGLVLVDGRLVSSLRGSPRNG